MEENELKIDPELKAFMPPLSEGEQAALEANIIANGCRVPLVVWDGTLVDGHHRYEICRKHNIPFTVEEQSFADKGEAKLWMLQEQRSRRNMGTVARTIKALELKPILMAKGKERQGHRSDLDNLFTVTKGHNTRQMIADIAGTSETMVHRIEKIMEVADEATMNAMMREEIKVGPTYAKLFPKKRSQASEGEAQDGESGASEGKAQATLDVQDDRVAQDKVAPPKSPSKAADETFRDPELNDIDVYTSVVESMFEDHGAFLRGWAEKLKDDFKDRKLIGKAEEYNRTIYAFGNALVVTSSGMDEASKKIHLTTAEKQVVEKIEKSLGELNNSIKSALDEISHSSVHGEFFTALMQSLKNGYIADSAEVFSYLWDVERLKTQRFGRDTDNDKSFMELLDAEEVAGNTLPGKG